MTSRKWEMFQDPSYYDMWAIRDNTDRSFNSQTLFHMETKEDAEALLKLLEKAK